MLSKIRRGRGGLARSRKSIVYLIALALAFAGAAFLRPILAQDGAGAVEKTERALQSITDKVPDNPLDEVGPTAARQSDIAHGFHPFGMFFDDAIASKYTDFERAALVAVLIIAVLGLLYALMLVKQVKQADKGTPRMQEIAAAVREGANAYLAAQFRKIAILIVVITVLLFFTYTGAEPAFGIGRALAFFMGSLFSFCVGFVGMRLATIGNLRVAAAAQRSYGEAMQLGYRTGT
ncbi:MAG: sodium/proton-translocating pyrophosphatase, partial [Tepidisphaeraceae bacterium]